MDIIRCAASHNRCKWVCIRAVTGDSWLHGSFPPSWHLEYISIKEQSYWPSVLTNQRVLFFSDNTAVEAVINKQTAKDPQLMCLVCQLIVACLSYNICFHAKHIPGRTMLLRILSHGCRSKERALFNPAWRTNQHRFPLIGFPGTQRPENNG